MKHETLTDHTDIRRREAERQPPRGGRGQRQRGARAQPAQGALRCWARLERAVCVLGTLGGEGWVQCYEGGPRGELMLDHNRLNKAL